MAFKTRRSLILIIFLAVALVVVVVPLLLFWPSGESIIIGEGDWSMPGGGPAHTAYLPFSPKGSLGEKWSTRLEGNVVGPAAVAGDRVYVCCDDGFLYCLELQTGRPVWRYDTAAGLTSMPAVCEDGIVLGTVDGRVLQIGPQGDLKWEIEVGGAVRSTPIPEGGRVYFGSSDGHLYCVSAEDGSRKWDFDAQSPVELSPCLADKQVYGVSFQGDLFALDAGDGTLKWTFRSKGIPVTFPAADDGKVFLATEFMIYCSDAQSGKLLWEYSPGPNVISNLAVRGNQAIVVHGTVGTTCEALALDSRTGDRLWNVIAGESPQWTWITATNQDVYLSVPNRLRALTVEDGMPSLDFELQDVLPHTFTVTELLLLAGTGTHKVHCYQE